MLKKIFGKKSEEEEGPRPVRANLGEENKFYYNEELKSWVVRGEEHLVEQKRNPPPPPPKRPITTDLGSRTESAASFSSGSQSTAGMRRNLYASTPGLNVVKSSRENLGPVIPPAAFHQAALIGTGGSGLDPSLESFDVPKAERSSDLGGDYYGEQVLEERDKAGLGSREPEGAGLPDVSPASVEGFGAVPDSFGFAQHFREEPGVSGPSSVNTSVSNPAVSLGARVLPPIPSLPNAAISGRSPRFQGLRRGSSFQESPLSFVSTPNGGQSLGNPPQDFAIQQGAPGGPGSHLGEKEQGPVGFESGASPSPRLARERAVPALSNSESDDLEFKYTQNDMRQRHRLRPLSEKSISGEGVELLDSSEEPGRRETALRLWSGASGRETEAAERAGPRLDPGLLDILSSFGFTFDERSHQLVEISEGDEVANSGPRSCLSEKGVGDCGAPEGARSLPRLCKGLKENRLRQLGALVGEALRGLQDSGSEYESLMETILNIGEITNRSFQDVSGTINMVMSNSDFIEKELMKTKSLYQDLLKKYKGVFKQYETDMVALRSELENERNLNISNSKEFDESLRRLQEELASNEASSSELLHQYYSYIQSLQQQFEEMQRGVQSREQELLLSAEQVPRLEAEAASLRTQLETKEQEARLASEALLASQRENQLLKQSTEERLGSLGKELERAELEKLEMAQERRQEVELLERFGREREVKIAALQESAEELRKEKEEACSQSERLRDENAIIRSQLERAAADKTQVEERLSRLALESDEKSSRISELEAALETEARKRDEASGELEELRDLSKGLQERLRDLEGERSLLELASSQEKERMAGEREALSRELEALSKELEDLRAESQTQVALSKEEAQRRLQVLEEELRAKTEDYSKHDPTGPPGVQLRTAVLAVPRSELQGRGRLAPPGEARGAGVGDRRRQRTGLGAGSQAGGGPGGGAEEQGPLGGGTGGGAEEQRPPGGGTGGGPGEQRPPGGARGPSGGGTRGGAEKQGPLGGGPGGDAEEQRPLGGGTRGGAEEQRPSGGRKEQEQGPERRCRGPAERERRGPRPAPPPGAGPGGLRREDRRPPGPACGQGLGDPRPETETGEPSRRRRLRQGEAGERETPGNQRGPLHQAGGVLQRHRPPQPPARVGPEVLPPGLRGHARKRPPPPRLLLPLCGVKKGESGLEDVWMAAATGETSRSADAYRKKCREAAENSGHDEQHGGRPQEPVVFQDPQLQELQLPAHDTSQGEAHERRLSGGPHFGLPGGDSVPELALQLGLAEHQVLGDPDKPQGLPQVPLYERRLQLQGRERSPVGAHPGGAQLGLYLLGPRVGPGLERLLWAQDSPGPQGRLHGRRHRDGGLQGRGLSRALRPRFLRQVRQHHGGVRDGPVVHGVRWDPQPRGDLLHELFAPVSLPHREVQEGGLLHPPSSSTRATALRAWRASFPPAPARTSPRAPASPAATRAAPLGQPPGPPDPSQLRPPGALLRAPDLQRARELPRADEVFRLGRGGRLHPARRPGAQQAALRPPRGGDEEHRGGREHQGPFRGRVRELHRVPGRGLHLPEEGELLRHPGRRGGSGVSGGGPGALRAGGGPGRREPLRGGGVREAEGQEGSPLPEVPPGRPVPPQEVPVQHPEHGHGQAERPLHLPGAAGPLRLRQPLPGTRRPSGPGDVRPAHGGHPPGGRPQRALLRLHTAQAGLGVVQVRRRESDSGLVLHRRRGQLRRLRVRGLGLPGEPGPRDPQEAQDPLGLHPGVRQGGPGPGASGGAGSPGGEPGPGGPWASSRPWPPASPSTPARAPAVRPLQEVPPRGSVGLVLSDPVHVPVPGEPCRRGVLLQVLPEPGDPRPAQHRDPDGLPGRFPDGAERVLRTAGLSGDAPGPRTPLPPAGPAPHGPAAPPGQRLQPDLLAEPGRPRDQQEEAGAEAVSGRDGRVPGQQPLADGGEDSDAPGEGRRAGDGVRGRFPVLDFHHWFENFENSVCLSLYLWDPLDGEFQQGHSAAGPLLLQVPDQGGGARQLGPPLARGEGLDPHLQQARGGPQESGPGQERPRPLGVLPADSFLPHPGPAETGPLHRVCLAEPLRHPLLREAPEGPGGAGPGAPGLLLRRLCEVPRGRYLLRVVPEDTVEDMIAKLRRGENVLAWSRAGGAPGPERRSLRPATASTAASPCSRAGTPSLTSWDRAGRLSGGAGSARQGGPGECVGDTGPQGRRWRSGPRRSTAGRQGGPAPEVRPGREECVQMEVLPSGRQRHADSQGRGAPRPRRRRRRRSRPRRASPPVPPHLQGCGGLRGGLRAPDSPAGPARPPGPAEERLQAPPDLRDGGEDSGVQIQGSGPGDADPEVQTQRLWDPDSGTRTQKCKLRTRTRGHRIQILRYASSSGAPSSRPSADLRAAVGLCDITLFFGSLGGSDPGTSPAAPSAGTCGASAAGAPRRRRRGGSGSRPRPGRSPRAVCTGRRGASGAPCPPWRGACRGRPGSRSRTS
ncbi:coiled coil protein [Cryptosporidium felis]|nr:coiled coil protein [Cryptosporidium felis]